MLAGHEGGDRVLELEAVVGRDEVLAAQDAARRVHASRALRDYIVALLRHTRADSRVELGASPRAGLMLLRAAKAHALLRRPRPRAARRRAGARPGVLVAPDHARARGRRRRARRDRDDGDRVDPGAVAEPGMRSAIGCAALGLLLLVVAGTFDAEPLYVTGAALMLLGAGAAALDRAGRPRGPGTADHRQAQRDRGGAAAGADRGHAPGGCRCRRAGSTSRCCPSRCGSPRGARRARVRVDVTFGRRGRRVLAPPALVLRDPFGLAQRVLTGAHADEVMVLPRVLPVRATAGGGDGINAHAPRRADRRGRDRDRRAARAPRGLARLADPLADRRARRRADGAQADLGGRLAAARGARPARAGLAGRARRDRAGGRLAHRALRAQDRLRAAAAGRSPRGHDRPRPAGLAAGARAAGADRRASGPALAAAQNRRGLVVFVAARVIDRPPRGLGRTPGGCLIVVPGAIAGRRSVLEVAGCQGFVGGRTGSAAVMAAVGGAA